ncbi:MAG: hypothetical protein RIS64_933 [Bacteroidota bacterium]|jgi:hypothetical protein
MFTRSIFFTNMQIEITKWTVAVLLIAAVPTAATAREPIENQSFTFNVPIQSLVNLDSTPIYVQTRAVKSERVLTGRKEGKTFELTLSDGTLTQLRVDGRNVSKSEFYKYETLTNEIIADMNAHAEARLSIPHLPATPQVGEAMPTGSAIEDKSILENLTQDGLMPPNSREVTLKLTAKQFWVNGKEQSESVFQKYKSLIEAQRGRQICSGCEVEMSLTPLHR